MTVFIVIVLKVISVSEHIMILTVCKKNSFITRNLGCSIAVLQNEEEVEQRRAFFSIYQINLNVVFFQPVCKACHIVFIELYLSVFRHLQLLSWFSNCFKFT